ncbi:MAG: pyridoxamine 5'-phosphate oxidase family protein [Sandaracinaceae bacterium]|nr:pyridoxamine 5'-phosphate oxidase family protein [Sandaracinaceae bacterium]
MIEPTLSHISPEHWAKAVAVARRTMFASIASIDGDGSPRVTPIGSVFLHPTEPRAYYLERFTAALPRNLRRDERCCLMFVDTSKSFWLASLVRGRFGHMPAVRLRARAGARREATPEELARFRRRVRLAKPLAGYGHLWADMSHARDLVIEGVEPVRAGAMTKDLW